MAEVRLTDQYGTRRAGGICASCGGLGVKRDKPWKPGRDTMTCSDGEPFITPQDLDRKTPPGQTLVEYVARVLVLERNRIAEFATLTDEQRNNYLLEAGEYLNQIETSVLFGEGDVTIVKPEPEPDREPPKEYITREEFEEWQRRFLLDLIDIRD